MAKLGLIPKFVSKDGKYLGVLSGKDLRKGKLSPIKLKDNNLEHILNGEIVCGGITEEGMYSFLFELNPPAPQRVIDLYFFQEKYFFEVGEVSQEYLKLYMNTVLLEGMNVNFDFEIKKLNKTVPIKGKVLHEEKINIARDYKYAFWIELDVPLSENNYAVLKKIDRDDMNNYFDEEFE